MSDWNIGHGGTSFEDPFAPEVVEDTIAASLGPDAPLTPTAVLVRNLADAYTLPPAADALLARSHATLSRHAEALAAGTLETEGERAISANSRPVATSFSTRPRQPASRRISPSATAWRTAAAVLSVALLGAGFFALLHGMPRPEVHPTPTATLACSEPGTTATSPIVRVALTPVPSLPPAEILSALEASPGFQNPVQVAHAPSNSTYSYDPPVLLLPATVGDTEDLGYYSLPHYIIVASVNGVRMVLYDVTYNPTTHEITPRGFDYWGSSDRPYGKPYPWFGVSSSAAVAALCSAKGLALAASTVPELVFFAPGPQITHTPSNWTGGGYNPIYPIWRLHGADGQLYFVGIDGNVYTPKQLPILPGTTFITQQ